MEALNGIKRQSDLLALISREEDRITTDRQYSSTMAATSLVSPTSIYPNGPPPPYSGWSGPPAHQASGLISPPESRRTSDNKAEPPPPPQIQTAPPQQRQSLPSIYEALGPEGPKTNSYISPVSASLPQSHHQLPYSQPQPQPPSIPRSYSEHTPCQPPIAPSQTRRAPSPVQPHAAPFLRTNSIASNFSESRHGSLTSLQAAPGPPPNPYAGPRNEPARYEHDPRAPERMSNGYAHQPPPPQQGSYSYGSPPGHMPPSGTQGPIYNQPRYQARDGREPIDSWKENGYKQEQPEFRHGLKRHLDVWDFENNLAQINTASRVIMEWSYHYNAIAQEQQRGSNAVPDRMPTIESCKEMMEHQEVIMLSLTRMKDMIHQQEHAAMIDQRMREQGGNGTDYDEEMSMYGEDVKNHGFGSAEGKKRRGRAAPPGRCHSCNRAETPEWRRGPDGARTLCNACGLHYAKLTRKNTMKQSQGSNGGSSLRPKSMDDHSPRPV